MATWVPCMTVLQRPAPCNMSSPPCGFRAIKCLSVSILGFRKTIESNKTIWPLVSHAGGWFCTAAAHPAVGATAGNDGPGLQPCKHARRAPPGERGAAPAAAAAPAAQRLGGTAAAAAAAGAAQRPPGSRGNAAPQQHDQPAAAGDHRTHQKRIASSEQLFPPLSECSPLHLCKPLGFHCDGTSQPRLVLACRHRSQHGRLLLYRVLLCCSSPRDHTTMRSRQQWCSRPQADRSG